MFHRRPPHRRYITTPNFQRLPPTKLHSYYPQTIGRFNIPTHPNSIPLRNPAFLFHSGRFLRKQGAEYPQSLPESSVRSSGPPPGFERKDADHKDIGFNPEKGRRAEEDKQIGKEKQGRGSKASLTIHISNVCVKEKKEEVIKCCSVFGNVEHFSSLKSYRFPDLMMCFVRFQTEEQAAKAVRRLGGTGRSTRSWKVNWARRDLKLGGDADMEKKEDEKRTKKKQDTELVGSFVEGVENREVIDFLDRSWMLVMDKHISMKELESIIESQGLQVASLIQWGMYGVIAVCNSEEQMRGWMENIHKIEKKFVKVEKIHSGFKMQKRYCWVEIAGIPVQAWSISTMRNIASQWGNLLALDIETDMAYRLDVAKVFMEVQGVEQITKSNDLKFQNDFYKLRVVEIQREEEQEFTKTQDSLLRRQSISSEEQPEVKSKDREEGEWVDKDERGNDDVAVVQIQNKKESNNEGITKGSLGRTRLTSLAQLVQQVKVVIIAILRKLGCVKHPQQK